MNSDISHSLFVSDIPYLIELIAHFAEIFLMHQTFIANDASNFSEKDGQQLNKDLRTEFYAGSSCA